MEVEKVPRKIEMIPKSAEKMKMAPIPRPRRRIEHWVITGASPARRGGPERNVKEGGEGTIVLT